MIRLLLVMITFVAFVQQAPEWRTYRSTTLKFEIRHPVQWKVEEYGPDDVWMSTSPYRDWIQGLGIPVPPNPWVEIHKVQGGCGGVRLAPGFTPLDVLPNGSPPAQEMAICQSGIVLVFGYWESDPNKKETRELLISMLASFKTI